MTTSVTPSPGNSTPTHNYMLPSTPTFRYAVTEDGKRRDTDTLTADQLYDEVMHCGVPLLEVIAITARGFQTGNPLAALSKALGTAACDAAKTTVSTGSGARPIPLNLMVCLVGKSGKGKGATADMPMVCSTSMGGYRRVTPASGEKLIDSFFDKVPAADGKGSDTVQHEEPVWATWSEIDAFAAKSGNANSTLDAIMRSLWTGETAGDISFTREKSGAGCVVPAGSYRFVMVVGAQPDHAGVLLDDETGGTLQRLLWFPIIDPHAPVVDEDSPTDEPDEVDIYKMQLEKLLGLPKGQLDDASAPSISVWGPAGGAVLSPDVKKILKAQRSRQLRDVDAGDDRDSHVTSLRVRLSAIFAGWRAGTTSAASSPVVIDREAWYWASCVTSISRLQRQVCVDAAEAKKTRTAKDAGRTDAERFSARQEALAAEAQVLVGETKVRLLRIARGVVGSASFGGRRRADPSKPATRSELYNNLSDRQKEVFKRAIAELLGEGELIPVEDGKTTRYAIPAPSAAQNIFNTVVNEGAA